MPKSRSPTKVTARHVCSRTGAPSGLTSTWDPQAQTACESVSHKQPRAHPQAGCRRDAGVVGRPTTSVCANGAGEFRSDSGGAHVALGGSHTNCCAAAPPSHAARSSSSRGSAYCRQPASRAGRSSIFGPRGGGGEGRMMGSERMRRSRVDGNDAAGGGGGAASAALLPVRFEALRWLVVVRE
eukprot:4573718-Prymnesium_polylepis.1